MRERPIIFNTRNVRAILDGRKIQTRRVIKIQEDWWNYVIPHSGGGWRATEADPNLSPECVNRGFNCPYGQVGDKLWVRESFKIFSLGGIGNNEELTISYKALGGLRTKKTNEIKARWQNWRFDKYTPSIFMPQWASRLTLEILNIRVERLQEITMKDCLAEGFVGDITNGTPKGKFMNLWDSINIKRGYGFDKNPWVWVIEFKKL